MTGFQTEGCGRLSAAGYGKGLRKRVLKMDRPNGRRVRKFDGPSGRGLWYRPWAMSIKSALRDWLSASYSMISILRIGSLRSPPPIRLRRTSPYTGGQNKTPQNTLFINGSTVSTGYSATVEVLHRTSKWGEVRRLACPLRRFPFAAPPNCGGKVVASATKGGISIARQGGCQGFIIRGCHL